MKLASFTDNSQSFLKYGDTNTFLHVQISEDGTFVDLTQAVEVNVPVANDDGLLFTKTIDPTKLANGDSGIVDINFTSDDQNNLPPDDYYLEIWVTNHDGTIGIYPADENQLSFTITDNLTLITGDVVPAVAFDDFQNMFNTLQQQVHDAIANGLKGDTGAKGDPGEGLDIKGRVTSVSELPTTANEGNGYLVNEELYVYTSGAWKDCGPIQGPQGVQGIQGKTGNGISSTAIQYQISNSATTTPTGTWSNTLIATTQVNPFLWTQVTLTYDDGTSKSFYVVSSKGDKGDTGAKGQSVWSFPYDIGANGKGRWWSDLKPTPTTDNPPRVGDTIVDLIGNVYQITNVAVGTVGGGGTFDFGSLLTSIKGPKGDTGPVGAGLVVKGTLNNASQLPTTGNQEGYCYFIGTDLYVWDAGAWKNCGSVSPDLSKYVTVTDLNNGLSTKVTDNKDGTEQLNGVKVQPFNKLSDTIGGRNLLINTAQLNDSTVCLDTKSNVSDTYLGLNIFQTAAQWGGVRIFWSYLAQKIKTNTNYVMSEYVRNTSPTKATFIGVYGTDTGVVFNSGISYSVAVLPPNSGWVRISAPVNIASFPTNIVGKLRFENGTTLTDGYVQFAGLKFEQGSIATDWTPAPEDKVNVSDMRKPASDVAGIEETVLDNHDGSITANGTSYDLSKSGLTPLQFVTSGSFNDLPLGTVMADATKMTDGPDKSHDFTTTTFYSTVYGGRKAQIAIADNTNLMFFRTGVGVSKWASWTLMSDDSKVVHSTDMRKPASDVVGLEDVPTAVVHSALTSGIDLNTVVTPGVYPFLAVSFINYIDNGTYWGYAVVTSEGAIVTQTLHTTGPALPLYRMKSGYPASWSPWVRMADDRAVPHLSGANDFDTVPTVNNTPLLTSDKLPDNIVKQGDVIGNIDYVMQNRYSMSDGKLDITTGGVVSDPSSSYKTTGFVYINSLIKNFTIVNSSTISKDALIVAFYDNTMKFISGVSFDGTTVNQKTINVPSNTVIIKFSIVYASADSISMYAGSNIIDTNNWPSYSGISLGGKQGATIDDVTTAISTATANMVDSTKATNFTAGLQSGGVDVATAADLKSIEASAWRQLDNKYVAVSDSEGKTLVGTYVLYRLDTTNKRLLFMFTFNVSPSNVTVMVNFSSIVNNISAPNLTSFSNYFIQHNSLDNGDITVSGNLLKVSLSSGAGYASSMYSMYTESGTTKSDFCFVNYDELV